jgi:hypothetical protein
LHPFCRSVLIRCGLVAFKTTSDLFLLKKCQLEAFFYTRDGDRGQLICNCGMLKPAFAERDKKQTMTDLRGISTNWFENQLCPSKRLSMLWAWYGSSTVPVLLQKTKKFKPSLISYIYPPGKSFVFFTWPSFDVGCGPKHCMP